MRLDIRVLFVALAVLAGNPAAMAQTIAPPAALPLTDHPPVTRPAQTHPAQTQPAPAQQVQTAPVQPQASQPALPVETQPAPAAPATAPGAAIPVEPPTAASAQPSATPKPVATASLPHDLSPWGMFMAADIVVKAVMIGLALASVITWTIWLAKTFELAAARRNTARGLGYLVQASSLDQAADALAGRKGRSKERANGPVARLIASAQDERERSEHLSADGIKERVAISLSRIEARAGRSMTKGTGVLATIGSTAPFVGLFGTVWGIMNSFIGISQAKTTNLAVVAPGIAEALLATAIGLVAAIPAVIIYNAFARSIAGYRAMLSDASGEVLRHLSRDLERAELRPARPQQPAATVVIPRAQAG